MKEVKVKNLSGTQTHGASYLDFSSEDELLAWVNKAKLNNFWGKKAGTYPQSQLTDDELLTAITFINTDEQGNLLQDPLVTIPDQYTIVIEDITSEVEQQQINAEALAYLASTDWMIVREVETGVSCPVEIKEARAAARLRVVN